MKFLRSKPGLALVLLLILLALGSLCYVWWTTPTLVTPASTVALTDPQVNVLAIGDWGDDTSAQRAVAASMARYASSLAPNSLQAVLSAGDNLYPDLDGVGDADFVNLFERMYDSQALSVPFYMILGNHDYVRGKAPIELEYAKVNPTSRWKQPAKWYRVDIPPGTPLVSAFMLDSNYKDLSREEWQSQLVWLDAELRSPRGARWLVVCGHHPLFSQGSRYGDSDVLIREWGPLLRQYEIDFYVFGHEHIMQHLEVPGYVTSFLGSAGGGGSIHDALPHGYGPYAAEIHGFVHVRFGEATADVNYLNRSGSPVHAFSRPVNVRRAAAAAAPTR